VELARLATRYAMAPMNPSEAPLVAGEGSLALARHLSERGDATAAIELAAAAAATFEASGYAYRAALAAMEGALALARGPAPEAAAGRLKEAFRQLAAIGAMREVERVRETLHLLNLRAPAPTRLRSDGAPTPREAEVAELASEGLTDRQIATRLDISERTVGTHMHRLLKKLGLKSRHELRHLSSTAGDIGATPHLA
jgi:DNA-binding NarL/FixJ family response regulator